jgi:hypothetical protein
MKLSQIQQSRSILPAGQQDNGGSWGIFLSPENPNHVIKLFYDEQQFSNEKIGYDKVLGENDLKMFANQYTVIPLQLDALTHPNNRITLPFSDALLLPLLSDPPWAIVGKLGTKETDDKLSEFGVNIEKLKVNFCQIGVTPWEVTFFMNSISHELKAIDFTFSNVVLSSNTNTQKLE